jgi:molecular chaperone DnaK (HSP70)
VRGRKTTTIGFDFGTSTTLVATEGDILGLGTDRARRWMPSVVGHTDSGEVVAGDRADTPAVKAVRSIKRMITANQKFVTVDLPTGVRDVRADDLMVALLAEARRLAAAAGQPLDRNTAVRLGCPAMWDGDQRRRLLDIATRADLPVTLDGLVDEPVAAGIAWLTGAQALRPGPLRIVVFDMGGGTLDIAVLDVQDGDRRNVAVLAALGVPEAGDALDRSLAEDLEQIIDVDLDAFANPASPRAELLDAARQVKLALTTDDEAPLTLSGKYFGNREIWYTREQLDAVFDAQMDRAEQAVAAALRAARLTEQAPGAVYDILRTPLDDLVDTVDVVVLSGGMAHVPYVRQRLGAMFNSGRTEIVFAYPPSHDARLIRAPELAVVVGLARAEHVGRINMYRPAFDIVLECHHRQEVRTVYRAFTPLVEPWQITRGGTDLRYVRNGTDLNVPENGSGRLRILSHTGGKIRATLGNRKLDGFPVALSDQKFEFSIYPHGRIRLVDAAGTHDGQLDDWHTIET